MTTRNQPHLLIRASAGSGKTHQLTNRYLALLAAGVEPSAILATTFTRKAAREILDRVLLRLAKAASEAGAAQELSAQLKIPPTNKQTFAELLSKVLQNLHCVRIGTLDSFYMALAACFDFELGMAPGWTIADEVDDDMQRMEALERILERDPTEFERILPLLRKGESSRLIHSDLNRVTASHHEIYRDSERQAWERLRWPAPLSEAQRKSTIGSLRACDLSRFDKRMTNARDKDIEHFEAANWHDFVGRGLGPKVASGEGTYYSKPIPPRVQELYEVLLRHAKSEIVRQLAEQTKATWGLLDRFDRDLSAHKQVSGQLRFGDVTHSLRRGVKNRDIRPGQLAFRLDGAIEHLLLDEFQDTSLAQWQVVRPLADAITGEGDAKSFFCVGDVKQAIYAWRGGNAEIVEALPRWLKTLKEERLIESRRSAQPIIDVINKVFGGLCHFDLEAKYQLGLDAWSKRFSIHTTAKKDIAGYVRLHAGPAKQKQETTAQFGVRFYHYAAEKIRDLAAKVPQISIGVLCRTNETIARLMYELRQLAVVASEEGGNPLPDSPAVELILSLLTLADHPGHSVAWFHLQNSPLRQHIESYTHADALSRALRAQLLKDNYGKFIHEWARRIAPACNDRDLGRLQQLVESAFTFERRGTLRADDFVSWVRAQRVPDPSTARVRVMTIHGAKGLEFDAVILPELNRTLADKPQAFVVGRDPDSLEANLVCRYAGEAEQTLLDEDIRSAFDKDRQRRVEESLSLLYVAMTRAKHALYMIVPGWTDKKSGGNSKWSHLLVQALAPQASPRENSALFEHGDANWHAHIELEKKVTQAPPTQPVPHFASPLKVGRRGLERIAPSSREGQGQIVLDKLFHPSEGTGMAAGTLYHAWFESIAWLDDGVPTDEKLQKIALRLRTKLSAETWRDLDRMKSLFLDWLDSPGIAAVLRRAAYSNSSQLGFPTSLAAIWQPSFRLQNVERERRFLVRDGEKFLNGSIDRIVWINDGDRLTAADVIDFKADDILPGDPNALAARTEHYRPQLNEYRKAVSGLSGLKPEFISARLVFASVGQVINV